MVIRLSPAKTSALPPSQAPHALYLRCGETAQPTRFPTQPQTPMRSRPPAEPSIMNSWRV